MKIVLRHLVFLTTALFLLACPAFISRAGPDKPPSDDKNPASLPPAEDVLRKVRTQLPTEPLLIKGRLLCGKRLGILEKAYYVDTFLELGQNPMSARYTLRDMFGTPVEQLTIIRKPDQAPVFKYEKGYPLQPAPVPDLYSAIKGTQITWNDLNLSFLWWQNGTTIGRENRLGRDCIIIEFASPVHKTNGLESARSETQVGLERPRRAESTVRLWIDEHLLLLIQMEEYDAQGNRQRRLSVKKIKKISDLWMIKDMEIRSYPSKHRTILRIDDITKGLEGDGTDWQGVGRGPNTKP